MNKAWSDDEESKTHDRENSENCMEESFRQLKEEVDVKEMESQVEAVCDKGGEVGAPKTDRMRMGTKCRSIWPAKLLFGFCKL